MRFEVKTLDPKLLPVFRDDLNISSPVCVLRRGVLGRRRGLDEVVDPLAICKGRVLHRHRFGEAVRVIYISRKGEEEESVKGKETIYAAWRRDETVQSSSPNSQMWRKKGEMWRERFS